MIDKKFTTSANPELLIQVQTGRIELRSGTEDSIRVQVETSDPNFIVEQRGDQIRISSDKETGRFSRGSAYVVVELPDTADVTVSTAAANFESDAPLRKVLAKTATGDFEISEAAEVSMKSASGNVRLGFIGESANVTSASGNASVDRVGGKLVFSSASGDLRVGECADQFTASTASGDIQVELFLGRKGRINSMSGSANIGIPTGTSLDLDANLLSGKLDVIKSPDGPSEQTREATLSAKMMSGDLLIRAV